MPESIGLPAPADPRPFGGAIASRELFSFLADAALDGAWWRPLDELEHERTTPGLWRTLGLAAAPEGDRISDRERLMLTEDRELARSQITRLRQDPTATVDDVIRYRYRNASTRWIRSIVRVIDPGPDEPPLLFGTWTDVSAQIRAERTADRLTAECQALADSVDSLVLAVNIDGSILTANRAVSDATRTTAESLVGHSVATILHQQLGGSAQRPPAGRPGPATIEGLGLGLGLGDPAQDIRVLRATQEHDRRLFVVRTTPFPDAEDGSPRQLLVADDITDLHRSKTKLASIFRHLPAALSAKDLDGRYLMVNPYTARLFSLDPAEMIGRTDRELLPPETAEIVIQADREAIATRGPVDMEKVVRLGDRALNLASITFPLHDADGAIYATAGISFDVSELHHLQEELSAKNAELERFVYTASHDLKSPLVTILGYSRYLSADLASGRIDELDDYAGRIRRAAEQMHATIDDLLEFSRIGRRESHPAAVDLHAMLADLESAMRPDLIARGVSLVTTLAADSVWCDPGDFRIVLENLLSNALRYGCGNEDPRITVISSTADNGSVRIEVADNGVGIKPSQAQRAFELFERLTSEGPGTGVGLAIVERIVLSSGGTITLTPTPGGGATFTIILPAAPAGN